MICCNRSRSIATRSINFPSFLLTAFVSGGRSARINYNLQRKQQFWNLDPDSARCRYIGTTKEPGLQSCYTECTVLSRTASARNGSMSAGRNALSNYVQRKQQFWKLNPDSAEGHNPGTSKVCQGHNPGTAKALFPQSSQRPAMPRPQSWYI